MKKNFLSFIIAILCAITCALCFGACTGGSHDSQPQKVFGDEIKPLRIAAILPMFTSGRRLREHTLRWRCF
jgi:hypothetical protein